MFSISYYLNGGSPQSTITEHEANSQLLRESMTISPNNQYAQTLYELIFAEQLSYHMCLNNFMMTVSTE